MCNWYNMLNDVIKTELALKDLSERILMGVGSKYGSKSDEYEMAGGVRKSERKKRINKFGNIISKGLRPFCYWCHLMHHL